MGAISTRLSAWLMQYGLKLLCLALLLGLCTSLSLQSWQWFKTLEQPPSRVLAQAANTAQTPAINPQLLTALFGEARSSATTPSNSNQRLTLLASFVHPDTERSSAVILDSEGRSKRLLVGSAVNTHTRLHSVAHNHVVLMRNGQQELLYFPKPQTLLSPSNTAGSEQAHPSLPSSSAEAALRDSNAEALQQRIQLLQSRLKQDHVMRSSTSPEVDHLP